MSKKDDFKTFVSKHPELITNVKNNNMTWQKYYEIYDLYGEDLEKWQVYFEERSPNTIGTITNLVKKIDVNSIQKHVNTAQKAINLFQELGTKKTAGSIITPKGPGTLRPINKIFED